MDILTSVPVTVRSGERIDTILEALNKRIAQRAYELYVERGSIDGHSLEDWLDAERDLVIRLVPEIWMDGEDITVEFVLPPRDMPDVAVLIAPRQFLITSDID